MAWTDLEHEVAEEFAVDRGAFELTVELLVLAKKAAQAADKERYQRKGLTSKTCPGCQKTFRAKRVDARVCSNTCRMRVKHGYKPRKAA